MPKHFANISTFYYTIGMVFLCFNTSAQFYNKEVKAKLLVEQNSEYYTFKATAENTTPSALNLRYDFMLFKQDEKGNTTKTNQENRFYLEANQKLILSSVTVNYYVEGKIIILLVIYDEKDKPIGQDRIELPLGGKTPLEQMKQSDSGPRSNDQAKPQDGFVLGGLVIENTITKLGRDFYRYFYADYYNREIQAAVNIYIDEVPGRGRTTLVSVKVGEQLVWQFLSQPKKEFLKKMAELAMQRTIMQLQRLQQQEAYTKY